MTMTMFERAVRAYAAMGDLRRRRTRLYNYTFGRQWLDPVPDPVSGRMVTERELAEQMGKKPLTNNLLRQLVKTVVGRFRHRMAGEGGRRSAPLSAVAAANQLDELDCRMLEEFLISGCAVQRMVSERRPAGEGVWIDNVDPSRFFVNSHSDPRGHDIELIGMLHDMGFAELAGRFAPRGGVEAERLRLIYGRGAPGPLGAAPEGRCRVAEVWSLDAATVVRRYDEATGEYAERESHPGHVCAPGERLDTRVEWVCRWYAHDGTLIAAYPSPWPHGSHPFALKLYPLTGGEIHSLVEDVIDQQRSVNRLTTLIDHVIGTSAKGVLLFPADQLPDGMTLDRVASEWARPDGIIPYLPKAGVPGPEQLVCGKEPMSAYRLLELELELMQQTSGVSAALSGQATEGNSRSAALYEAQSAASGIALLDMFAAFDAFRAGRDEKVNMLCGAGLHEG